MKNPHGIAVLFLDIGGVPLTNGWDRRMRGRAAEEFGLDFDEMDERHNLTFDTCSWRSHGVLVCTAFFMRAWIKR